MGLDVYRMKIDDNGEEVILYSDLFPGKSYTTRLEFYHFEKYLENCGIDPSRFSGFEISDLGISISLVDGALDPIVDDSLIPVFYEDQYAIKASEINYIRGTAKESYYEEFTDCWYKNSGLTEAEADKYRFVKDQEVLDQIKKHFEKYSPIHDWKLEDDEFVWFSY